MVAVGGGARGTGREEPGGGGGGGDMEPDMDALGRACGGEKEGVEMGLGGTEAGIGLAVNWSSTSVY